jgi:hypothetical protein
LPKEQTRKEGVFGSGQFEEQMNFAIQAATATALQGWAEQAAELQVLRANKANRDLRGPGFWKLDKANCEA